MLADKDHTALVSTVSIYNILFKTTMDVSFMHSFKFRLWPSFLDNNLRHNQLRNHYCYY